MLTKPFTLPLSRWHHVADRIREIGERKHQNAFQTLSAAQLSLGVPVTAEQVEALRKRGATALGDADSARAAKIAVGNIREALARENAKYGITALLAKAESKRQLVRQLAQYAALDLVTRVPLDSVQQVIKDAAGSTDALGRRGVLPVTLVASNTFDSFKDEISALESEVASITDEVADLNRNTLTLELPAELAQAAGL